MSFCCYLLFMALPMTILGMKTFEETLGDPFEDCIVTRQPFDPKLCQCEERSRFRTIDGTCNNLKYPIQGASFTRVQRFLKAAYARDGGIPIGFPIFSKFNKVNQVPFPFQRKSILRELLHFTPKFIETVRPTAQEVSDEIFQVADKDMDMNKVAHIFMTFGQFIDHDLVIIENEPERCLNPSCRTLADFKHPCNPILFSSNGPGCNPFARSRADCNSRKKTREQVNQVTSYIDGSMIYGSTDDESRRLRTSEGKLLVNEKNLLPFDVFNPRPCREFFGCFLAGDIRVNENIALTSMHTVWVRLHNVIAEKMTKLNRRVWDDERIFQESRQIVIAILQKITFYDFLPYITDIKPFNPKNKRNVDASVNNGFATAAYRFGHSLVRNAFDQLNNNYEIARQQVPLQNAFNNIKPILQNGIEETIFGLLGNDSQKVDTTFSEGIAERLFIPPKERGFQSLVVLNIQRGRDHGLPSYTEYRKLCKIPPAINRRISSFADFQNEITNKDSLKALKRLYKSTDNHIDLFPAGIAESPYKGKIVGPTFGCLIGRQFQRARDGDRFYFERIFNKRQINEIKKITLANVLCETLDGIVSIQDDVFKGFDAGFMKRKACNKNDLLNFGLWRERPRGDEMSEMDYFEK